MPVTEYIRMCLMYLKLLCRAHDIAVILVAHPTKAVAENGGRTPLLSDIEGSMSWYNKCDNGLVVVRDTERGSCRVISAKVREQGAGKVGSCHFSRWTRRPEFSLPCTGPSMSADPLASIEAILAEIEQLDLVTRAQHRQAIDREALEVASRIECKMLVNRRMADAPTFKPRC